MEEAQTSRLPVSGLLNFWKTQESSFHSCADSRHLSTSSASVDRLSLSTSGIDGGSAHPEKGKSAGGQVDTDTIGKSTYGTVDCAPREEDCTIQKNTGNEGFNTNDGSRTDRSLASGSTDTNSSGIGRTRARLHASSSDEGMEASLNNSLVQRQVARWNLHDPASTNSCSRVPTPFVIKQRGSHKPNKAFSSSASATNKASDDVNSSIESTRSCPNAEIVDLADMSRESHLGAQTRKEGVLSSNRFHSRQTIHGGVKEQSICSMEGGQSFPSLGNDGCSTSSNSNCAMADVQNTSTESCGSIKTNTSMISYSDSVSIKASNTSFSKMMMSAKCDSSGNNQSLITFRAGCDPNVSQTVQQWSVNSISSSQSLEDRLDDLHAAAAEVVRRHTEDEKKDDDEDEQESQEPAPNASSDFVTDSSGNLRQQGSKHRKDCNTPIKMNQQNHRHATPSTVAETPSPSSKDVRVTFDDAEQNGDSGCYVVNRSFADRFPGELESSPPELDLTSIHSDGASTQHHFSVEDSGIDQLNVSQDSLEHSIGHNSSIDLNRSGDTERMLARVVSAAGAALSQDSPEEYHQQEGLHLGFDRQRQRMQKEQTRIRYPYTPARLNAANVGANVHCNHVTPGKPVLSQKQLETLARGTTPRRSNQQEIPSHQERFAGMRNSEKRWMSHHVKPLKSSAQQQRDFSYPEMQQTAVSFDSDHDSLSFSTGGHSVDNAEETASIFLMNALLDLVRPLAEDPLENTDDYSICSDDGSSTIDTLGNLSFQKSNENISGSKTMDRTSSMANTPNLHSASIREASIAKLQEWWQLELLKSIATDEENNGTNEETTGNDTPDLSYSVYNLEKLLFMEFQKMSFEDYNGKQSKPSFESIKRDWLAALMNVTEAAQGDALCGADNRFDALGQTESSKSTAQLERLKTLISRFQKSKKQSVDRSSESHVAAFEIDLDGNPEQISGTQKASHNASATESSPKLLIKHSEAETTIRQSSDTASNLRAEIVRAPLLDDELSEDFASPDNSLIQCTSSRENSLLHNSATSSNSTQATILMSNDSPTGDGSCKEAFAGNEQVVPFSILASANNVKLSTEHRATVSSEKTQRDVPSLLATAGENCVTDAVANLQASQQSRASNAESAALTSVNNALLPTEHMASSELLANAVRMNGQAQTSVGPNTKTAAGSHFDSLQTSADVRFSLGRQFSETTAEDKVVALGHEGDSKPELHKTMYADPPLSDNLLDRSMDSESTAPPLKVSSSANHTNNSDTSSQACMEASIPADVAVPSVTSRCPLLNTTLDATGGGRFIPEVQATESTMLKQIHDNKKRRVPRIRITTLRGDGRTCEQTPTLAGSPASWTENKPSLEHAEAFLSDHGQQKETAKIDPVLLEVENCSSSLASGGESDKLLLRTVSYQQLKLASPSKAQETDLTHLGSELVLQDLSTQGNVYAIVDQPDEVWQDLLDAQVNCLPLSNSLLTHFGEECTLAEHRLFELHSLDSGAAETASPNSFLCNKSPGLLVSQSDLEIEPIVTEKSVVAPTTAPEQMENSRGVTDGNPVPPSLPPKLTRRIVDSLFDMQSETWEDFGSSSSKIFTPTKAGRGKVVLPNSAEMTLACSTETCDHPDSLTKHDSAKSLPQGECVLSEPRKKKSFAKMSEVRNVSDNPYMDASYLQFAAGLKQLPVHARRAGDNVYIKVVEKVSNDQNLQQNPIVTPVSDSWQSETKGRDGLKQSRTSKLWASVGKRNLRKAHQSTKSAPMSGKPLRIQPSSEKTAKQDYCTSSQSGQLNMDASPVRSCVHAISQSPENPSMACKATKAKEKTTGLFAALDDLNESWTDFSSLGRTTFAFGHSRIIEKLPELHPAGSFASDSNLRDKIASSALEAEDAPSSKTCAQSVLSVSEFSTNNLVPSGRMVSSTQSESSTGPVSSRSHVAPSTSQCASSRSSMPSSKKSTTVSNRVGGPVVPSHRTLRATSPTSIELTSNKTSSSTASLGSNCSQRILSAENVSVNPRPSLEKACKQVSTGFEPNNSSEWEDFSGSAVFDVFEPTKFVASNKKKKTKSHTVKTGRGSRLIHI